MHQIKEKMKPQIRIQGFKPCQKGSNSNSSVLEIFINKIRSLVYDQYCIVVKTDRFELFANHILPHKMPMFLLLLKLLARNYFVKIC